MLLLLPFLLLLLLLLLPLSIQKLLCLFLDAFHLPDAPADGLQDREIEDP